MTAWAPRPEAGALEGLAAAGAGALAAAAAAAVLVPLAARAGWLDRASGPEAARKLQDRPVPPVGGAAILVGLCVELWMGAALFAPVEGALLAAPSRPLCLAALALAFLVGLADDLLPGGLSPGRKALGQAAIGVVLGAPAWSDPASLGAIATGAGWVLAALAATNLWNTFDNADGAATALGGAGLAAAGSSLCGAALGFLPWNLARPSGGRAPRAYLGDSGSHVLGISLLLSPDAWPAFLLPALDLARLCIVRWRRGSRPWRGDRRHLAHRLAARGLGRGAVLAALLAIAAPALLWRNLGGALATAALFVAALVATPDPDRAAAERAA